MNSLQIKEAMKASLINHVDCIMDPNCVLLPRLLEFYEKRENCQDYLLEKALKDKSTLKD